MWWATARTVDPALLAPPVRARLAAMRVPEDRHRHATAALLGDVLARTHGGPHARVARVRGAAPRVVGADGPLHMSVAHTGHVVVVALAPHPVGVDVELDDVDADAGGIDAALTAREAEAIAALPGAERVHALLRAWVRKEAVLKAIGTGLARDPRTVELSPPGRPAAVLAPADLAAPGAMALHDLLGPPGAVASLAVLGAAHAVEEHDGDALLDVAGA